MPAAPAAQVLVRTTPVPSQRLSFGHHLPQVRHARSSRTSLVTRVVLYNSNINSITGMPLSMFLLPFARPLSSYVGRDRQRHPSLCLHNSVLCSCTSSGPEGGETSRKSCRSSNSSSCTPPPPPFFLQPRSLSLISIPGLAPRTTLIHPHMHTAATVLKVVRSF